MNKQIIRAFDEIHAEEALKAKTLASVTAQTAKHSRKSFRLAPMAGALACLVLIVLGSLRLYHTPSVVISMDINPSVELTVNRFNRIIKAEGINEDGTNLLDTVHVENLAYSDAVSKVMESEKITSLLERSEVLEIGVIGDNNQSEKILNELSAYTQNSTQISCYSASMEELNAAHAIGMSCGKYRVYLVLQEAGIELSPDEAQHMSMRRLRELCAEAGIENELGTGCGNGHHGYGKNAENPPHYGKQSKKNYSKKS